MIKLYIPSYNRPMQCAALLDSIDQFDESFLFDQIDVCYQGSTSEFSKGYDKLVEEKKTSIVNFIKKSGNHYDDVSKSLEICDFWAISTDDSLFYRPFKLNKIQLNKLLEQDTSHFTFRLGLNTTIIDFMTPKETMEISGRKLEGGFVKFYWPNHQSHAGHPFALDSTIMRKEYINQLIMKSCSPSQFNYRYFECKINDYMRMNPNRPFGICSESSNLVNSPNNMCTEGNDVRNGVKYKYTLEDLNQKWLDGYKIDINSIDIDSIISVQQELEYRFIKQ